jgi:hypothetical protein
MKHWDYPETLESEEFGTYTKIAEVEGVFVYFCEQYDEDYLDLEYAISSVTELGGNFDLESKGWFVHVDDPSFLLMGIDEVYPLVIEKAVLEYIQLHRKLRS